MGSVADKIAKRMASARGSKVVDMAGWREGRKLALEAGFGGEGPVPSKFKDLEPCHGIYVMAENIVSVIAESISMLREAKGFARIVGDAEEEYMPKGPPMSPLTVSHFAMWAFFDVRFGSSRETMGSCIFRMAAVLDFPDWLTDTVRLLQGSRMGFYVNCGSEGGAVLLREVGERETVSCTVPSGYSGSEGEIWFVRVLPPPHELCRRHIVFTTPYVIRDHSEREFAEYLSRELVRMKAQRKPPRTDDLHGHLMKHGPEPNHWNEYILCSYTGHQHEAIFLTGIPDIRESLPHASTYRAAARRGPACFHVVGAQGIDVLRDTRQALHHTALSGRWARSENVTWVKGAIPVNLARKVSRTDSELRKCGDDSIAG